MCVALVGVNELQLPACAPLLRGNAKKAECLRQRCTDRYCKHRSKAELEKLAEQEEAARMAKQTTAVDPTAEIEPDDREVNDDGVWPEDAEAEGHGQSQAEDGEEAPARTYLIDLYPFSRPENFYAGLYAMTGIAGTQSAIILSTTAHPASSIAARACNIPVHVLLDRPGEHSVRHGQADVHVKFNFHAKSLSDHSILLVGACFAAIPGNLHCGGGG